MPSKFIDGPEGLFRVRSKYLLLPIFARKLPFDQPVGAVMKNPSQRDARTTVPDLPSTYRAPGKSARRAACQGQARWPGTASAPRHCPTRAAPGRAAPPTLLPAHIAAFIHCPRGQRRPRQVAAHRVQRSPHAAMLERAAHRRGHSVTARSDMATPQTAAGVDPQPYRCRNIIEHCRSLYDDNSRWKRAVPVWQASGCS